MKAQYILRHLSFFLDHPPNSEIDHAHSLRGERTNPAIMVGSKAIPVPTQVNRFLLHAVTWTTVYFIWMIVFQRRSFTLSHTATIQFCYLIFIAANFYFNIYFALPNYLYRRRYLLYALLFMWGIGMAALLRVPLASYLNAHYFLVGKPQPGRDDLFISSFINVFIWTAIITSAKLIYDHFHFEESLMLLRKEKSKVEFDLLNAQMNPHFLFNSLNTIYGEIDRHNSIARNLILSFSNMLRYQLYDCNHQLVQMRNELDYVENYVSLQRARMEQDVDVLLTIEEQLGNFYIAPLLFISFIENAFKYLSPSELYGNKVEISFSKTREGILFRCFNTVNTLHRSKNESGGIGVSNVRKRLSLHYPGRHDLQIVNHEQYFLVELIIEANEMEMRHS